MSGTFPLPEAQMDRFLMRITMGTPSREDEVHILNRFKKEEPLAELTPVCKAEELQQLQEECRDIFVHPLLIDYIVDLVQATRNTPHAVTGVSPRGTLALLRASQAYALVQNRNYVVPEDIKSISVSVLAHRLVLNTGVQRENSAAQIIQELLNKIPVPTEDWTK